MEHDLEQLEAECKEASKASREACARVIAARRAKAPKVVMVGLHGEWQEKHRAALRLRGELEKAKQGRADG